MKSMRFLLASLILLSINSVYGATIKGKVTDATSGDPLVGAHVSIVGTSLGIASDIEGGYSIQNLPMGTHSVKFSYIGFDEVRHTITITNLDQTLILDAKMEIGSIVGQEVVVSAQAVGQLSAINQQLSSDAVVSIVDGARIRALPNQNAAEAIARLPGITITNNNGEGSGVGIRGLSPQYNIVQIDGVAMGSSPDMGRAQDYSGGGIGSVSESGRAQDYNAGGNRSVSLSSVSQENLSGIEVYKAILADMDAATLGGTVNLRLGRAPSENVYDAKLFGAYNAYEDDWSNYKVSAKVSSRFFDDLFGVQLSLDGERRNRGNDRLNGDIQREDIYQADSSRIAQYRTGGSSIRNLRVLNEKLGFNAILDFASEGTEILFSNFYSSGARTTRETMRDISALSGYRTDSKTYSVSSSLRGTHTISDLEAEWQLSISDTKTETPDDYRIRWEMKSPDANQNPERYAKYVAQTKAFNEVNRIQITPENLIMLLPDEGDWYFTEIFKDNGSVSETKYAAKLDFKYPFHIEEISGFVKTGLLLRQVDRANDFKQRSLYNGRFPGNYIPAWRDFVTDYNGDPVLNGAVSIRHFFDVDKIRSMWDNLGLDSYPYSAYEPIKTENRSYDVKENYYAGYLMMKMAAFNDVLTFIPGVRYEGDSFDNTGYYWWLINESTIVKNGLYEERNAKRNHGFWLPMVHLKIKPVEWFDTRLAITKTISRPNFNQLIPSVTASYKSDFTTSIGNPDLKTTESWNYDLALSAYDSKFGLFTITGFYKEITNFAYDLRFFIKDQKDAIKYGLNPAEPGFVDVLNKELITPVNTDGVATVKGLEIEYQANFLFLPGLLKNIVFGINYTRIWSSSQLPKYSVTTKFVTLPVPPYFRIDKTYDEGFREGRLPTQPDHILNVSLGYDIGGFTGRVSAFYQGESLSRVGLIEIADTYQGDYLRYDMSLRYKVSDNFSLLLSGVNLTSTPYFSTLSGTDKHSSYAVYGAMYDFGVQVSF